MGPSGILHALYSLRAEGCPRLALDLLQEETAQTGRRGTIAIATTENAELLAETERLDVPVIHLHWSRRGFVKLARTARRAFLEAQPRGVICYTVGLHVSITMAASGLKIPVVVHLGNAPPASDRVARSKIRLQMLAGAPFVSRYAACSDYVRRECISAYGLSPEKVVTVPNGIRLEKFSRAPNADAKPNGHGLLTIGMVGSLEAHKDQLMLLEAVRLLAERDVNVRLRLIGDGTRRDALRESAQRLGIAERVEWVGTARDVPAELAQLDVFAYSVREEEGLGIALVEALASGLPVVASDTGACREVLEGGKLGQLVEGRSAAAWAESLMAAKAMKIEAAPSLSRYDIRQTFSAYDALLGNS
ncbi:MAG TPA: glycosyltransferase [Pyrinomonadaceae bacterium]|nr:glycosyltransferase [Pyrinomonadaceae bacterium]